MIIYETYIIIFRLAYFTPTLSVPAHHRQAMYLAHRDTIFYITSMMPGSQLSQ